MEKEGLTNFLRVGDGNIQIKTILRFIVLELRLKRRLVIKFKLYEYNSN